MNPFQSEFPWLPCLLFLPIAFGALMSLVFWAIGLGRWLVRMASKLQDTSSFAGALKDEDSRIPSFVD